MSFLLEFLLGFDGHVLIVPDFDSPIQRARRNQRLSDTRVHPSDFLGMELLKDVFELGSPRLPLQSPAHRHPPKSPLPSHKSTKKSIKQKQPHEELPKEEMMGERIAKIIMGR